MLEEAKKSEKKFFALCIMCKRSLGDEEWSLEQDFSFGVNKKQGSFH